VTSQTAENVVSRKKEKQNINFDKNIYFIFFLMDMDCVCVGNRLARLDWA
jgi:hypothetical protein